MKSYTLRGSLQESQRERPKGPPLSWKTKPRSVWKGKASRKPGECNCWEINRDILWHFPHSLPKAPGTLISNVLPFSEARPAAATIEGRGEGVLMKLLPSSKPLPPRSIQHHPCEQRQEEAARASCHHQTANENQGVCEQKLPACSPSNDHPGEYKFENVYYSAGTRLPQQR